MYGHGVSCSDFTLPKVQCTLQLHPTWSSDLFGFIGASRTIMVILSMINNAHQEKATSDMWLHSWTVIWRHIRYIKTVFTQTTPIIGCQARWDALSPLLTCLKLQHLLSTHKRNTRVIINQAYFMITPFQQFEVPEWSPMYSKASITCTWMRSTPKPAPAIVQTNHTWQVKLLSKLQTNASLMPVKALRTVELALP